MEESAFPQQQPIFMGGKLPLKPGLLLEATEDKEACIERVQPPRFWYNVRMIFYHWDNLKKEGNIA